MWRRSDPAPAGPRPAPPRDVEALEHALATLDSGVSDAQDAHVKVVSALAEATGMAYAAVWLPDPDGEFRLRWQGGELEDAMAARWTGSAAMTPGLGNGGRALQQREPVLLTEPAPPGGCARWETATAAGALTGCFVPALDGGRVVAVYEFYARGPMPLFGGVRAKWEAILRILSHGRSAALAAAALQENIDDRVAVTTVVAEVGEALDEGTALRTALETVRTAFGWEYGSYWRLDAGAGVLRPDVESGSVGEEFRRATQAASYAPGVGLCGRAWGTRDLVYVRDVAELTDCVRAPAARRAGVRSGVCFPITAGGTVVGAMDFVATRTIELSESRLSALRNVQQLVSQRVDVLRRAEKDAASSRALLETVSRLREAAAAAGRVAEAAVAQAQTMTTEVQALGHASASIGEVIRIISAIADQTNLLALNATIEAARAGELGRGFAVVAGEVKELARETASATQRVTDEIAGLQASSRSVAAGIHTTSEIVGELDAVQARIGEVLEEQVRMATAFESRT